VGDRIMTKAETDKLLYLISKGDNNAFETLYVKTKNGVYSFLYTYVHNHADTEDLMQTVYLKIKTTPEELKKPPQTGKLNNLSLHLQSSLSSVLLFPLL
jgi:hypothetical protein